MTRRDHAYVGVRVTSAGHVGLCHCSWESEPQWDRRTAQVVVVAHIAAARVTVTT